MVKDLKARMENGCIWKRHGSCQLGKLVKGDWPSSSVTKKKKATDDKADGGQAIRSSIGYLNAYSDSGGMILNFLAKQ